MAKFNATGIEGLQMDLEQYLSLPAEAVDAILEAEGKVIEAAQKARIQSIPLVRTGTALKSIKTIPKISRSGGRYFVVSPSGTHNTYVRSNKVVTNQDVLFVHEYGAPRRGIKARHWQRDANEQSAEAAAAAGQAALDRYLESKNL